MLSGCTVDTNFAYLARALEATSVEVMWHSTVGDSMNASPRELGRAPSAPIRS